MQMSMTAIGLGASVAGTVGVALLAAADGAPFLEYGALGLAALMVVIGYKNNEATRKDQVSRERVLSDIIDANRKNLETLHHETRDILTEVVERNTKAMEGCVEHQRGGRVRT